LNTVVDSIEGEGRVTHMKLRNLLTDECTEFTVGGVFIFIGFIPNTQLVDTHVDHDPAGYYKTDPMSMETSVPGVFAAGDVRSQLTRQVTTAVGDATTATIAASKWVEEWHKTRSTSRAEKGLKALEDAAEKGDWIP
jgi:thioredoxin reductase (NADPH)